MSDERKVKLVSVGDSFLDRALAVTFSSSSPNTTTIVASPTLMDVPALRADALRPKLDRELPASVPAQGFPQFERGRAVRRADKSPKATPQDTELRNAATAITVDPTFKMVFLSAFGLTLITLIATIALALIDHQTDAIKEARDWCGTLAKMGFGAVIGLIGGKSTRVG